ncbi:MATE family efflux transporter [Rhodobacterales bacterium 52_120_T64]|nr:MATE family efflux transporter [Rhodobacterales bacterium 52_120_T64]
MTSSDTTPPASAQSNSWSAHFSATLALGLPLIGTQMAQMGINFIDTVMLGWLGAETLAASVLATTLFFIVLVVGFGLANAVMPLAAQASGEGDIRSLRRSVRMGFWVVMIYGALMMPILWNTETILLAIGQKPELASMAQEYVRVAQWAIFPVLTVSVLRSYLSALERMQIVLWITLVAVGVNAFLNYMFIFGNFGAPRLELAGAAVATVCTNTLSAIALVIYCLRVPELREHDIFSRLWRPDWVAFREVFRLGLPISLTILAEVGLFAAASLMMGWLGVIELASHGIALQIASISFMIPLSFSQVGTVRFARAVGRKDTEGMDRAGKTVLVLGVGFAVLAALIFILFPVPLISMYLDKSNPDARLIINYGTPLLAVAAAFQLVDTLQAIGAGLLRGMKDTQVPMYIAIFSYWAIGVPAAYYFGFVMDFGGQGIWSGLALGLAVAAVLMNWRYFKREKLGLMKL